jgi:hypothetical protein
LPRRHALTLTAPADEQILARLLVGGANVIIDRLADLVGQLEADRTTCLPLPHGGAVGGVAVRRDVLDLDGDDITAAQFAVDFEVNMASSRVRPSSWSGVRIDQTCFGERGGLAPMSLPLFQGTRGVFW